MNLKTGFIFVLVVGQLALCLSFARAVEKQGGNLFSAVPTAMMDDPRRIEWQKPAQVVDHLLIKKGDVVADVGAGTGYFSLLLGQKVGKGGMVFAVDIDRDMVVHVEKKVKRGGLHNIRGILASADDPKLQKNSADLVFMCDTYVFIENRLQYLGLLRDALKNKGRLALISFNMKEEIPGAPPPHRRVTREQIVQEAEQAGFVLEAEYFFLPYQYFLVFEKSGAVSSD